MKQRKKKFWRKLARAFRKHNKTMQHQNIRAFQPPAYTPTLYGAPAYKPNPESCRTPDELFDLYCKRVYQLTDGSMFEFRDLSDFEMVHKRGEQVLKDLDDESMLRDYADFYPDYEILKGKIAKLGLLVRRNKDLTETWMRLEDAHEKTAADYQLISSAERGMEQSAKDAYQMIREMSPLPLRGFFLHVISQTGTIAAYTGLSPLRVLRCHVEVYTKYKVLYAMSKFNDHTVKYGVTPYMTMFHTAPKAKYPDFMPWDSNHPEFCEPTVAMSYSPDCWD